MRRLDVAMAVVVAAVIGFFLAYADVQNNVAYALSPYRPAMDQLVSAQTAQTPDEVTHYAANAKTQLPESGPVSWWPSEKGDLKSIQTELDGIIGRAKNISVLEPESELFISEMNDTHSRLGMIQKTLEL